MKTEQTAIIYLKRSKYAPVLSVRQSDAQFIMEIGFNYLNSDLLLI